MSESVAKRTLIYIPMIHTQADMGALKEPIQRLKIRRLGRQAWERNVSLVDKLWDEIERTIESLDLNYDRVWLYQDGLPVCGRELELVDELARADSRNHRLLQHLREKGATIMGTESSELLVEEYQLFKNVLASGTAPIAALGEARRRALQDSLLKRRDQYIAQRINDTLPKGETGLVFLGMLHSVAPWLDKNIQVIYPVHQPLHKRAKVL